MTDPMTQRVLFEQCIDLPFKVDPVFIDKQGFLGKKMIKYSKTGEVWVHIQLIEDGAVQSQFSDSSHTFAPPATISIVSNSVAPTEVDDMTMALSMLSSPSVSYETIRSCRSVINMYVDNSIARNTRIHNNMAPPPARPSPSNAVAAAAAPPSGRPAGLAEMAAAVAIARGSAQSVTTEQKRRLPCYVATNGGKRRAVAEDDTVTEAPGAGILVETVDELTVDQSL